MNKADLHRQFMTLSNAGSDKKLGCIDVCHSHSSLLLEYRSSAHADNSISSLLCKALTAISDVFIPSSFGSKPVSSTLLMDAYYTVI